MPPAAALADQAFTKAVLPLANTYSDLAGHVPGLGDTTTPAPGAGDVLATIANINNRILATLPADIAAHSR